MSVQYCHDCDRCYDEDFNLECPGCGRSAAAQEPTREAAPSRWREAMERVNQLATEFNVETSDSADLDYLLGDICMIAREALSRGAPPSPTPTAEEVARIIRGWDKPTGRIGPGTRRAIINADAKADEILALFQPEGRERS